MNKKSLRNLALVPVILFISVLLINIVSAQAYLDLRQGSEQVIEWTVDFAEPLLQVLLGGYDYTGLLLFERFLVFILLLCIVYLSLKNISLFEDTPAVLWVVSLVVPLMAVRFINFEWLNTILITYQVLGIAIAGIFPFIIYFFFLHNITDSSTVRKIGWIFFIVIYFGLWSTNESDNYAQVYFWTMLIALVFLLMDGTIHRYFQKQKWKEAERDAVYKRIAELDKDISSIEKSNLDLKQKTHQLKRLEKERKRMYDRISKLKL